MDSFAYTEQRQNYIALFVHDERLYCIYNYLKEAANLSNHIIDRFHLNLILSYQNIYILQFI